MPIIAVDFAIISGTEQCNEYMRQDDVNNVLLKESRRLVKLAEENMAFYPS